MEKNEKNLYPQVPQQSTFTDVPPSYDQSFNPTAPSLMNDHMQGLMPLQPQPQQQQQQPQTVIIQAPQLPPLGPKPCVITCPSCHQQSMSKVRLETSTKTHLFALLLCVLGLCCCACVPYCVDTCKNPNHYCKNCNAYLGKYEN